MPEAATPAPAVSSPLNARPAARQSDPVAVAEPVDDEEVVEPDEEQHAPPPSSGLKPLLYPCPSTTARSATTQKKRNLRSPASRKYYRSKKTTILQSDYKGMASGKAGNHGVHVVYVVYALTPADDDESEGENNDEIEDPEPDYTPSTWKQAMSCKNALHWTRAAEEEVKGMQLNSSYELVPRPTGKGTNVIDSKWVWRKKTDRWGRVKRFRARLTARGYKQKEGIDYFETFAPVMRYKSLLILLTFAAERDYEIRHLDVPKAFLQALLNEEIFMEQPEGFSQWRQRRRVEALEVSLRDQTSVQQLERRIEQVPAVDRNDTTENRFVHLRDDSARVDDYWRWECSLMISYPLSAQQTARIGRSSSMR